VAELEAITGNPLNVIIEQNILNLPKYGTVD
jgi:hypothetical protein